MNEDVDTVDMSSQGSTKAASFVERCVCMHSSIHANLENTSTLNVTKTTMHMTDNSLLLV